MRIVIIGNGVAGITAARYLRKYSDQEIIVVSEEAPYHFSRPAMMYVSMGHMTLDQTKPYEDGFWKKNRIELLHDAVTSIGYAEGPFRSVELRSGSSIDADIVIFATGSQPAWYGWQGEHLPGVQGYVTKHDLDLLERNLVGARNAVVVGGGLIGIEAAEVLHSRGVRVTMLVREKSFYAKVLPEEESMIITQHVEDHGIDLRCATELKAIVAGDDAARVDHVLTTTGERIQCDVVVLATGVKPRVDLARSSGLSVSRGIVVNDRFETSAPNVYAIGDCAEFDHGVEQLWYTARAHGEHLARVITQGEGAYARGAYFNSAKFFDLEWQIYGTVSADSTGATSVFWRDPMSERCLRIAHNHGTVIGIHAIGIRLRQDVCERWIQSGQSLDVVQAEFRSAIFDPEFSRKVTI